MNRATEAIRGYLEDVPDDSAALEVYRQLAPVGSTDDWAGDSGGEGREERKPRDVKLRVDVRPGTTWVDSPVQLRSAFRDEVVGYNRGRGRYSNVSSWDLSTIDLYDRETETARPSPEREEFAMTWRGYSPSSASGSVSGDEESARLLPARSV